MMSLDILTGTSYVSSQGRYVPSKCCKVRGYDTIERRTKPSLIACRWLDKPDSLLMATLNGTQSSMLLTLQTPFYSATAKVWTCCCSSLYPILPCTCTAHACGGAMMPVSN